VDIGGLFSYCRPTYGSPLIAVPQHIRSPQRAATHVVGEATLASSSPRLPSNRNFAWVMAIAWSAVGVLLYLKGRHWGAAATGSIAVAFALAGLVRPAVLASLNRLWMALGALLGRIITPLVMGFLFFAVVSPIALLMRRTRKDDPLRRTFEPGQDSYWIRRDAPGPDGPSMKRQY
jgi:hypothetical protein